MKVSQGQRRKPVLHPTPHLDLPAGHRALSRMEVEKGSGRVTGRKPVFNELGRKRKHKAP